MTEIEKNYLKGEDLKSLPVSVIRLPKLLRILGISRSAVYLKIKKDSKYYDQHFPRPIKLGEKSVGWVLKDVCDYIEFMKNGIK